MTILSVFFFIPFYFLLFSLINNFCPLGKKNKGFTTTPYTYNHQPIPMAPPPLYTATAPQTTYPTFQPQVQVDKERGFTINDD